MSFNQLPEELVAEVASHVGPEDMVNLLQTQKRVNRSMKKNRMDKPKIESLIFEFQTYLGYCVNKLTGTTHGEEEKKLTGLIKNLEDKEAVQHVISKFRSIKHLDILSKDGLRLDNELVSILTNPRIKIKKIGLVIDVDLKPKEFLNFCTQNFVVDLVSARNRPQLFCDEIFCQISSKNIVHLGFYPYGDDNGSMDLSDRWLETMMTCKTQSEFYLAKARTNFTIGGIRRYIKEFMKVPRHMCDDLNCDDHCLHFGILAGHQRESAEQWMNLVNKNTELDYFIKKYGPVNETGETYTLIILEVANEYVLEIHSLRPLSRGIVDARQEQLDAFGDQIRI